ncbi:BPH1 [Candida pseudojiufengensis]|uniref:BPH1 n=1 Tax=Candida pseudojiufengensis TaxID=497109 RepID=UPI002224126F|nr:BPH1 [Candida pseudojiufengensis]KAI5963761.1 BPH1 [Candida pseudojiufengensis]
MTENRKNEDEENEYARIIKNLTHLIPSFIIDERNLVQWQDIISERFINSGISDVIPQLVEYVPDREGPVHADSLTSILQELNDTNMSLEFKSIILEIIYYMVSFNYNVKLKFHKNLYLFVSSYISHLKTVEVTNVYFENNPSYVGQMHKIILSLMELGCDSKIFREITSVLTSTSLPSSKFIILNLLDQICETYPAYFPWMSTTQQINLPFDGTISKSFTFYSWLKLEDYGQSQDPIIIFTLSSSDPSSIQSNMTLNFKLIHGSQFMVELNNLSNKSRTQFVFNQIIHDPSKLSQVVLTFSENTNLNLYLNGEYSESIPCPAIHNDCINWNKLSIGDDILKNNAELILRNFTLLNTSLTIEWIRFLFGLGVGYNWIMKNQDPETIRNLINQLSKRALFNYNVKLLEKNHSASNSFKHSRRSSIGKLTSLAKDSNNTQNISYTNKDNLVDSLNKFSEEGVLYDSNNFFTETNFQSTKPDSKLQFHNPHSIYQYFQTFNFLTTLLQNLEMSMEITDTKLRDSTFYRTLDLLLKTVLNDWRLYNEFQSINGFEILMLLFKKYKNINNNLDFTLYDYMGDQIAETSGCRGVNLLNVLLKFCGFDFEDKSNSAIFDLDCYRVLVLDFDLFHGTYSFGFLLNHVQSLISSSNYRNHNLMKLKKANLLKKLIFFMQSSKLKDVQFEEEEKEQLYQLLKTILILDSSADAIIMVSSYIIHALYNTENSSTCGIIALQALTDCLCDPNVSIKLLKKFSRSITVHWVLLLFNFESDVVVCCGIRLLVRLLKLLGGHVMKQFFIVNRGLDVLTSSLKNWWNNEKVLCSIFLASYSNFTETNFKITTLEPQNQDKIEMPEFLYLLNYLELNAMYTMSSETGKLMGSAPSTPIQSESAHNISLILDVIHSINRYIDWLKAYKVLSNLKRPKEFIEGLVELLGFLKLSTTWYETETICENLKKTYEKLVDFVANFYISNLSTPNFNLSLKNLTEFSKIILLDLVFPQIFKHVNEFISISNFVHNENYFFNNVAQFLIIYEQELIYKKYFINFDNMTCFIICTISVIDYGVGIESNRLKNILSESILLNLLKVSSDADIVLNSYSKELTKFLKDLLYRQITIFDKAVLTKEQLVVAIKLILGVVLSTEQEVNPEIPFNFLRTAYLLRQYEFGDIILQLNCDKTLMEDFFQNLVSKNDDETLMKLRKYPPFVKSILHESQILKRCFAKKEFMRVSNIISVSLHNGGKLGQMNSIYIKSFQKDCERIKKTIMIGESTKYNRAVQDLKENTNHYLQTFYSLKLETKRILDDNKTKNGYVLDYIENFDRMRTRLIQEEQLPHSEKFGYHFDIPLKKVDDYDESNEYDFAFVGHDIDTMNLTKEDKDHVDNEIDSDPNNNDEDTATEFDDKNRRVSRSLYVGDKITASWNVSRINALVPVESLMILGVSHIYLIENYFHGEDGNIIDVDDAPDEQKDPILKLVNSQSKTLDKSNFKSHRSTNWSLDKLSSISKRQFLLRDNALEMFFSDGAGILITCLTTKERNAIYNKLQNLATGKGIDYELANALLFNSVSDSNESFSSKLVFAFSNVSINNSYALSATQKWKRGEISNFYYLMIINTLAGRTFNDLTQYPVFPWVIADYTSETLDLSNPKTFRDLSKPMGAQTEGRASQFKERFEALNSLNDIDSPAFHYGTHYSSAMIVTSFLIRLKPYVQSYLLLQGGKFDHADRLFNSIEKAWSSASKDHTTDVRELIPEFFYLPDFLLNSNKFEFGKLQNGKSVDNVELPPWAKGDPKIFIAKNREALESPYVSANLHSWIDLIFGYKQNGIEAIDALNVFHHYSYNGAINLDHIHDEVEKKAIIGMINNFGQTPIKIFQKPHIMKEVLNIPNYYLNLIDINSKPNLEFESKLKSPIVKLELSTIKSNRWVGRQQCVSCEDNLLIYKSKKSKFSGGSILVNNKIFENLHCCEISFILQIGSKFFITCGEDGLINVWKCNLKPNISLEFVATLRGHFNRITSIVCSKNFKIAISIDEAGKLIVWDLIRFKFIRKIEPPNDLTFKIQKSLISISNTTGNFTVLYEGENDNLLKIFNINGNLILKTKQLNQNKINAISFGLTDLPNLKSDKNSNHYNHVYWSNEILAIATTTKIEIFEITYDNDTTKDNWSLKLIQNIDLQNKIQGDITSIQLFKCSEIDNDEKLIRGMLKLVIGDSLGKVYTL